MTGPKCTEKIDRSYYSGGPREGGGNGEEWWIGKLLRKEIRQEMEVHFNVGGEREGGASFSCLLNELSSDSPNPESSRTDISSHTARALAVPHHSSGAQATREWVPTQEEGNANTV